MDKDTRVEGIKALCRNIIPYFEITFFNRYIQDYKNYLWYTWDRQALVEDWQTNVFFPMIPAIVDTMFASMYDSKIKFNMHWEGVEWTDKLLNNAFDYEQTGKEALMESIKECLIVGKWYMKPVFMKYKENKFVNGKDYWQEIKRPTLNYVSVFNIFYDYNSTLQNSAYTIERYILSRKQIIKAYASKITNTEPIPYIDLILNLKEKDRYSEFDINRIKHIISYEQMILKWNMSTIIPTREVRNQNWQWEETIESRNNVYAVDFIKNTVYEVIEYNDDDWTIVIIDGNKLFEKKNEVKTNATLFTDISFNKIPGTSDATWVSTNLWELQQITNTLYNIYLDNLKIQISPMFEQVWGLNQMLGKKNKITYSPYKVIPTNTPWSLRKIELWVAWFEPINAIQFIEQFAEKRSWVNEYIMWGQGKVERIAWGVDLIFNQYKSKLMPLTNSINNSMWFIAKHFLLMYAINYTEAELKELWLIDKLDLNKFLNEKNVTFHLSSLSLLTEEEGIKNLTESLALLWPYLQWQNGMNINTKELVKGILKRDVDVDWILKTENKPQYTQSPNYWVNNESSWKPDLTSMINNLNIK
jgi:hypothetical protein